MIALRPRDQHVWDPRPLPHETETETKTNYCETETETKKWFRDHAGLETLTSLRRRRRDADRKFRNNTPWMNYILVVFFYFSSWRNLTRPFTHRRSAAGVSRRLPKTLKMAKLANLQERACVIIKPMADGPSFSYEKLVRETWYKKLVYKLHTEPSKFLVRETWRMTQSMI